MSETANRPPWVTPRKSGKHGNNTKAVLSDGKDRFFRYKDHFFVKKACKERGKVVCYEKSPFGSLGNGQRPGLGAAHPAADFGCGGTAEPADRLCSSDPFSGGPAVLLPETHRQGPDGGRRFALSGPVYCISCHCWYGQSGRCGWGYHLRRTGGHFLDVGLRLFRHGHEICRGGPCPALSGPGAGWLCRWPHVHDSEGPGGEMAAHGGGLRSVRRVCRFRRGQRHPNQRLCGWGQ